MQKIKLEDYSRTLCFWTKVYTREKQVVYSLISIYFDRLKLAHNQNKLYKTLAYWSRDMTNFDLLEKSLVFIFSHTSCAEFFKKTVSHVIFY